MGTAVSQIQNIADKWGVDNFLMLLIGIEMLWIAHLKRRDHANFHRICTLRWQAFFFIGFALTHDLYRFRFLRPFLLKFVSSFVWWNTVIILVFGFALFVSLTHDLRKLLERRRRTEYVKQQRQKAVFDRYYRRNPHSND